MRNGGYGALLFVIVTASVLLQFLLISNYGYLDFRKELNRYVDEQQSMYSAKSCLHIALLFLAEDFTYRQTYEFKEDRISCSILSMSDTSSLGGTKTVEIQTEGIYKDATTTLRSIVEVQDLDLHILSTKKI
ncbi:MAG: hypothetical protein RL094_384 [Candidatus Parcubacteria bacterium]|jgi:2-iminoacetate synthase ThiH